MKTPILFILLVIMQAIHSAEEIIFRLYEKMPVASGKMHDITGFFPVLSMSGRTFLILNIIIVLLMLWISILVFRNNSLAVRFSVFISVIEIINGILHISASLIFWEYFPGSVSGIGLIIISVIYLSKAFQRKRVI